MNSDTAQILFGSIPDEYRKEFFQKLLGELRTQYNQLTSPGVVRSTTLNLSNVPTSNTGLRVGDAWADDSFLRLYGGSAQTTLAAKITAGATSYLASLLTTRGQLITRNATVPTTLNIGASGTVLSSDGTDPSWATVATVLANLLTARGQIIRRGASAPEALAAATSNTFLGGDGTDIGVRTAAQVLASLAAVGTTFQPLDTDLTTIAGLTATTDNFIQSVSSAWASRTPAQVRSSLLLDGLNYTPTGTGVTNVDSVTPGEANYIRVGSSVFVSFYAAVDPTAAASTTTVFRLSLPIASNLSNTDQLSGSGSTQGIWNAVDITGDTTNDAASVRFQSPVTTAIGLVGTFGYRII